LSQSSAARAAEAKHFASLDWGLFAVLATVWGSSFLFIEVGLRAFEPGLITWLRVIFGAAAIWLLPSARSAAIAPDHRRTILLLSFTAVAIPFTLFPIAQGSVTSAVAGLMNGGVALMTALIGFLVFRRIPARHQIWGLALGAIGVGMIALLTAEQGTNEAIAVGLLLAAIACYGLSLNLFGPLVTRYGSVPVMARMLAWACVWTTPFGVLSLGDSSFSWAALVGCLFLGALGTGIGYAIVGRLIRDVGSVRASYVTNLVPVVALFLGVAVLGEVVPSLTYLGAALVVAGAVLVSRPKAGSNAI
jgi:drug/metabolite transporter (DMT)-like permease